MHAHRCGPVARLAPLAFALAFTVSLGHARAEPAGSTPGGFVLGDPVFDTPPDALRPLWVDSQGRVLGRSGHGGGIQCWLPGATAGAPMTMGPWLIENTRLPGEEQLHDGSTPFWWSATVAGDDRAWVIAQRPLGPGLRLYRAACGAPASWVADVTLPADWRPLPFAGDFSTVAASPSGLLLLAYDHGGAGPGAGRDLQLARVDTTATPPTVTTVIDHAGLLALVGAMTWPEGTTEADAAARERWSFRAAVALADGRFWVAVEEVLDGGDPATGDPTATAFLEVGGDGVAKALRPIDPTLRGVRRMVASKTPAVVFIDGLTRTRIGPGAPWSLLGLVPLADPAAMFNASTPPWSVAAGVTDGTGATEWDGLIGTSDGQVLALTRDWHGEQAVAYRARPLALDAQADRDADGIPSDAELARGTDPWRADSDGDGLIDGVERELTHTDPTKPDAPASGSPLPPTAPSLAPGRWTLEHAATSYHLGTRYTPNELNHDLAATPLHPGVACFALDYHVADSAIMTAYDDNVCVDGDGRLLTAEPLAGPPTVSLDGGYVFSASAATLAPHQYRPDGGVLRERLVADGDEGATVFLPAGTIAYPIEGLWPLDPERVVVEGALNGASILDLYTSASAQPVRLADATRAACPLVANATELGQCELGDATFAGRVPGGAGELRVVGGDPELGLVIRAESVVGWLYYAFDGERLTLLASGVTLPGSGAYRLFLRPSRDGFVGVSSDARTVDFDRHLAARRELGYSTNLREHYRHGFEDDDVVTYIWVNQGTGAGGGCIYSGDYMICDQGSLLAHDGTLVHSFQAAEHVPVPDGLEPGEAIFFAGTDHPQQDGEPLLDHWALWRMTRLGGAQPWLDAAAFKALVSTVDQAAAGLATTPLHFVDSLGAHPDGLRVCAVEPGPGRAWELTLDASTRRATSVRLVDGGGHAAACAYDAEGGLGLALAEPSRLRLPSGIEIALPGGAPRDLVYADGRWIAGLGVAESASIACVGGDGVPRSPLARKAVALGAAPEGVVWVDGYSAARITTGASLCEGDGQGELLADPKVSFWSVAYGGFTTFPMLPRHAAIALRPDGMLLTASRSLLGQVIPPPQMLMTVRAGFHPDNWGARFESLDPLRREYEGQGRTVTVRAGALGAVVVLPGATASGDWNELSPPVEPWRDPGAPDPGAEPTPDADPEASPTRKSDGGCAGGGSGGGLAGALALALAALRGRWGKA